MEDWKRRIMAEQEQKARAIPEWKRRIMEEQAIKAREYTQGPDENNIDDSAEAPALVRMAVGALDKPEDRLNALRKHYPDARPYDDDNFIYSDPETGKTVIYNRESWIPSLGDFASIAPEIGETVGGIGGAAVGGIGGAAAGSAVPVVGTAAGGVSGAIAGAGTGSVAGREGVQRGLNWLFGNEDTRTGKEQLADAGITFALGAGGEGVGRLAGAGVKAGRNAWNKRIIGEIDPTAEVAKRAEDMRAIGIDPTVGMVSGSDRTAKLEHALIPTRSGGIIEDRINDAFRAQDNEFSRIVNGISNKPLSVAEAGEALRAQTELAKKAGFARSEDLYRQAGEKITSPAVVDATTDFLNRMQLERAGFGEFDKLTRGSATDKVIEQASAIVADAQNGMTFDKLKQARTVIGKLAADENDKVMQGHLNDLYRSLSDDMQNTALASGDDAKQAFNKANNHYRRLVNDETGFGKGSVADSALKKDTDQLFNWATANAKHGGNRIASMRRLVEKSEGGKEAWNDMVAGFTERLGMNSADEFEPGVFLRNWRKTSQEAKDALFKGTTNSQYAKDLDRLSNIADNWTKYRKNANHSNTAAHQSAINSMNPLSRENVLGTALGTAAAMASGGSAAAGLAIGSAKGAAKGAATGVMRGSRVKLLTSPETVNWLAGVPAAEMRKGGIKAHLKNLVGIRNTTRDQALAAAIDDYFRDLRYDENEQ